MYIIHNIITDIYSYHYNDMTEVSRERKLDEHLVETHTEFVPIIQ